MSASVMTCILTHTHTPCDHTLITHVCDQLPTDTCGPMEPRFAGSGPGQEEQLLLLYSSLTPPLNMVFMGHSPVYSQSHHLWVFVCLDIIEIFLQCLPLYTQLNPNLGLSITVFC